jgi:hypothetical protein
MDGCADTVIRLYRLNRGVFGGRNGRSNTGDTASRRSMSPIPCRCEVSVIRVRTGGKKCLNATP